MKNKFITIVLLYLTFSVSLSGSEEVIKQIKMEVGEETIIHIPNLKGISNAGDTVEDVILNDGESVMLRGISWGDTLVTGWDGTGKKWIHKIHVEMPKYVKELKQFLHEIEGVNVNFLGKNIIVEGQLLRESDIPKLNGILKNFPEVKNMVNEKTPKSSDVLIESIKAELYNYNFKFSFLGEGLMYEGNVFTNAESVKAKNIGQFYFDSTYPAITVIQPEVDFHINIFKTNTTNPNSIFLKYLSQAKEKSDKQSIITYPFFETTNHNQAIDIISQNKDTVSIFNKNLKRKSEEELSLIIEQKDDLSFSLIILAKVVNKRWLDAQIGIKISQGTTTVCKETKRVILRNGQGLALGNVVSVILNKTANEHKNLIAKFKILNAIIKDPNYDLTLLITPLYSLRN